MTKKIVITYKYDDKGNIVEKTETTTEYIENYTPCYPTPSNPLYPIYYEIPKQPKYYDYTITCTSSMNDFANKVVDSINSSLNRKSYGV